MTDLLISPPWWLYCSVIVAGIIVWMSGNKRTDVRVRTAGLAVVGLGVLMAILSFMIETDSQKVSRLSKELVQSVKDENWDKMQSLLTSDVKVSIGDQPLIKSRDGVMQTTKQSIKLYGLRGASAQVEETTKQDYLIITTVRVYTTGGEDLGHPLPSRWQLDWEKASDGHWAVRDIRALEIGNTKGSDMSNLIRPR